MGGIFGVASKNSCVLDLFFGIDYHSHLGTRRGGMAVYDPEKGFDRAIPNLTKMFLNCRGILESAVSQIMNHSRSWSVLILGILRSQQSARSTIWKN